MPEPQGLIIRGRLPTLNEMMNAKRQRYGGQADGYSVMKKKAGQMIGECILAAKLQPMKSPVVVELIWCATDRRTDPDNIAAGKKFILDALVTHGVLEDDGWKQVAGFMDRFKVDKGNPGVEVLITEVTD